MLLHFALEPNPYACLTNTLIDYPSPFRFPIYIYHSDDYDFYGLPIHNNSGAKIGIDVGGPAVTPETRTFTPDPAREEICTKFLNELIPKVGLKAGGTM